MRGTVVIDDELLGIVDWDDALHGFIEDEDGELMTDLSMTRGDSRRFTFNITTDDDETPVDLSEAVLRFALKETFDQTLAEAKVVKTSYDDEEIEIADDFDANEATLYLRSEDTVDVEAGRYVWALEVNRKAEAEPVTGTGTASFTAASDIVTLTGADFSAIRVGSIFEPAGGVAANQKRTLITAVDATEETIRTEGYSSWQTEAAVPFEIFNGDRKTPEGLSGSLTLAPDAVA